MIPRHLQIAIGLLLLGFFAGATYMFQLRQHDIRTGRNSTGQLPVAAPQTGPQTRITLAIAYDDDEVIQNKEVNAALPAERAGRARDLIRTLVAEYAQKPSPHALGENSDVRDVFVLENGLYVVDLNSAFAEGHRSGILLEQMTLASIVETLSANMPEVKRVKFIVEGKERATLAGHADLSSPYDAASIHQFIAELR